MTETELLKNRWQELINRCPLSRDTALAIGNVSCSQLSIVRYYGGVIYNGKQYIYVPEIDAIIREDVHKWAMQEMKQAKPKETVDNTAKLF